MQDAITHPHTSSRQNTAPPGRPGLPGSSNSSPSTLFPESRQPFHTDLSDSCWKRLTSTVLAPLAGTQDLREVINALRYRDVAACPWHLLPPGFPAADQLREHWRALKADGLWEKIQKLVEEDATPARPVLSLVGRARRAVARAARRLPGGTVGLWPGRATIQAAEFVLSRFTTAARLPTWFARAHRLAHRKEHAAAIDLYTRIIAVDPVNHHCFLRRAWARLTLDQWAGACADLWAALVLPDMSFQDRVQAYFHLSQALTLMGRADQGVGYGTLARLSLRFGPATPWDADEPAEGPDEFETLSDAHNDLAEYAINTRADFPTALTLYRMRDGVRDRYARWLAQVPPRTLYLSEDWVRNIGHMALIDFWVKMDRMGWRTWDRMVLIAPPGRTANRAYVDYYAPYFQVVRTDSVPSGLRHLVTTFGPRVASALRLPDGSTGYFPETMGVIQEAWEREGRGPLLQLTHQDQEFGRKQLRAMGVPDGSWFVCFHVRSPGFHKEGALAHQSHRNADIRTYLPAIREVVRRGGWVIRLGDPSMPALPPEPGVIDYARGKFKSARMDVFLCAGCRFFVGVASGISHLPTTFGVPCVLTNWLSNVLPVYSGRDLFLPKLLRSVRDGRVLPFEQYLDPATRLLSYSGDSLADAGYETVDNTPDELLGAGGEMLDRGGGIEIPNPEADRAVAGFDALARAAGLAGFPRIGRAFAAKHRGLLLAEAHDRISRAA